LPPNRILQDAKLTLRPSLAFSYTGSVYCTTLEQRASAKICGKLQGMELRNFRRGRHLYAAGRSSRWASSHILVSACFSAKWCQRLLYTFLYTMGTYFIRL